MTLQTMATASSLGIIIQPAASPPIRDQSTESGALIKACFQQTVYRNMPRILQTVTTVAFNWFGLSLITSATPFSPPNSIDSQILPPTNLTSYPWRCWTVPDPRINPTTARDCRLVAEKVQKLSPYHQPPAFGTNDDPSIDFLLPMTLTAESCEIRLLALGQAPYLSDRFTLRYLGHTINRMAQQCVVPWPHQGGEGAIGPKEVIGLAVGGILRPKGLVEPGRLVIEQGTSRKTIIL